ncbi:MAG: M28 family metallopeptidase [Bryobacteraceae bacterium]|nr:M28 family metallopeptidase [Bryobacteraceae bacterium]
MMKHAILLLSVLCAPATAQAPIRGYTAGQAAKLREWEGKLNSLPEPDRIRAYMRRMSAEPHHAGSPGSKAVAEYAAGLMKEWGLDARIESFEALLPYPTQRSLEMIAPVKFTAKLREPALGADPDSGDANQLPTYNAYSASGDVTGEVVYVNYGIPADYEWLKKQGIDVKGKIVLARYGGSWRGVKPKVAAENGAIACLIYSDPRDDGYFQGDVYPKGAFRPEDGVQRGSVMDMAVYSGDPLSPGWASEPGSKRLKREESKTLMKIPVIPISYGDARPLLEHLNGPVAPEAWRGALPLTYHAGPGPAKARLKVDFDWTTKPVHNVIARIPGSEFPGEWVIYGNHHDAWVNGASDPVSGASALLETARALGELWKQGWRPKRTIILALWDAEEFGLVGSTEWVEKHRQELVDKAVFYLNSDSNGRGWMGAQGSHSLEVFMNELLRDLKDPASGKSLLEAAQSRPGPRAAGKDFRLGPLGAGSDYVAFIHHAGIASVNAGFGGQDAGGVYHSIYDSLAWYTRFADQDFAYGKALSQFAGTMLLRLADAPVLPFEFASVARAVRGYVEDLSKLSGGGELDFRAVSEQLARLEKASAEYEMALAGAVARSGAAAKPKLAELNRTLYRSERALLLEGGLPGREWFRHQLTAPGLYTGYGAKTLPGVREAAEAARWEEARQQTARVAAALSGFSAQVEQAASQARALAN